MGITIIVAAPGTNLSPIAKALGERTGLSHLDVERRLIDDLSEHDRKEVRKHVMGDAMDMAAVTRSFPRRFVLQLWADALRKCLVEPTSTTPEVESSDTVDTEAPRDTPDSESRPDEVQKPITKGLLACHLTLYRNDRSEYYSTVGLLTAELVRQGIEVDNVLLLIDDVYDMYVRLAHETGALNAEDRAGRWMQFTRKVTPSDLWASLNKDGASEDAHLSLETSIQTLNLLVSWRRQESLAAEALAGAVGARFTAYGIKHSIDGAAKLVSTAPSSLKRIYISHPISAYRREINALVAEGVQPTEDSWNTAVAECNELPALLQAEGTVVAVMPTAIDELRFNPLRHDASRLTERSPMLGSRWPLMENGLGLLSKPDGEATEYDDVQHANLLMEGRAAVEDTPFAGELARFLEGLMFIEIPYRDHLIVANSDGLLVYRPLSDQAHLSSGVDHEVRHWRDRVRLEDDPSKLAVVHTEADLRGVARLWDGTAEWIGAKLEPEDVPRARASAASKTVSRIRTLAAAHLVEIRDLELDEALSILDGQRSTVEHLGGIAELATKLASRTAADNAYLAGIEQHLMSTLGVARDYATGRLGLFLIDQGIRLTKVRIAAIRTFFGAGEVDQKPLLLDIGDDENFSPTSILGSPAVLRSFFDVDTALEAKTLASRLKHAPSQQELASHFADLGKAYALAWFAKLENRQPAAD